ncbi:AP-4-A phosphorylase [Frankia sp. AiPs1]|uniref:HIT family protein n=1 Tax=Frankia sp. AiPa1 TaxID=573492 RepID=UPI00202B4366|nr:HIT domain-containing protein [Frankia sp. AiPa1]MCL9758016.1 HIT domain-containing protein [Frankia sp. AiPa1]
MTIQPPAGGIPLEAQAGVGLPDAFQRLYTPHRLAYIKGAGRGRDDECPFCAIVRMSDEDGLVVARGKSVYAVLNLYPYNAGHLLVVPYRHVADYADMDSEEIIEMAFFVRRSLRVLRAASDAHGFNTGMNLGHVAGAGIAAHVHQHVVPRWGGDANFMPVIGATKVLPALLGETRDMLAEQWARTDPDQ